MLFLIHLIQNFYNFINIETVANRGDLYGIAAIFFIFTMILWQFFNGEESKTKLNKNPLWSSLFKARTEVWSKFNSFQNREELEELLHKADISPRMISELLGKLPRENKDFKDFLYQFLKDKLTPIQGSLSAQLPPKGDKVPEVILFLGINGAGKTTTLGKLAAKLTGKGSSVVVGSCDTFRAAAGEQLKVWCERTGAVLIEGKEGSKPSGVAYSALKYAQEERKDYCLIDTAGRLHNNKNLMEELKKLKNVLQKLSCNSACHTWLVIDAITGQNSLAQAQEFHKHLHVDGLVFTKCDGSSKAGSAVSILYELKIPIIYIGLGENSTDLALFDLDNYLKNLLDMKII